MQKRKWEEMNLVFVGQGKNISIAVGLYRKINNKVVTTNIDPIDISKNFLFLKICSKLSF